MTDDDSLERKSIHQHNSYNIKIIYNNKIFAFFIYSILKKTFSFYINNTKLMQTNVLNHKNKININTVKTLSQKCIFSVISIFSTQVMVGQMRLLLYVCSFLSITQHRTAPGFNKNIELRKVREQDQVKFYYHNRTIKSTKRK